MLGGAKVSLNIDWEQYRRDAEYSKTQPLPRRVIPVGNGIEVFGLPGFEKKRGRYLLSLTNAGEAVDKTHKSIGRFLESNDLKAISGAVFKLDTFAVENAQKPIVINGVTIPKGYINATQMCQANGKLWGNYKQLKSTTEYCQGLETDIGIPISGLILDIPGSGDEQSTWVHPEVAVDLGQWVSTPFRIWVNRTITRFMVQQQQSIGISAQYQLVVEFIRQTVR